MPTTEDWNWYVVMLNQALLGVISSNIRMVTLYYTNENWLVEVVLEKENACDLEAIDDAIDEFSIYLEDIRDRLSKGLLKEISKTVIVDQGELLPAFNAIGSRVVFLKRDI